MWFRSVSNNSNTICLYRGEGVAGTGTGVSARARRTKFPSVQQEIAERMCAHVIVRFPVSRKQNVLHRHHLRWCNASQAGDFRRDGRQPSEETGRTLACFSSRRNRNSRTMRSASSRTSKTLSMCLIATFLLSFVRQRPALCGPGTPASQANHLAYAQPRAALNLPPRHRCRQSGGYPRLSQAERTVCRHPKAACVVKSHQTTP
jgi:hypothetical protein